MTAFRHPPCKGPYTHPATSAPSLHPLRIILACVAAATIAVILASAGAKGVANLADFKAQNGVYPHD